MGSTSWVLYTVSPGFVSFDDTLRVMVQSLATGERKVVMEGARGTQYVPTGHLVYLLDRVLLAVPFDVDTQQVTGGPVPLEEGVADGAGFTGAAHFAIASTGALLYVPGAIGALGTSGALSLVWVNRQGEMVSSVLDFEVFGYPRLSPDDAKVAAAVPGDDGLEVWVRDLERGFNTRLTETGTNAVPSWTPDGKSVTFTSDRAGTGVLDVYWRPLDRSSETSLLVSSSSLKTAGGWSPDGRTLIYYELNGDQRDLLEQTGQPAGGQRLSASFEELKARVLADKGLQDLDQPRFAGPFRGGGDVQIRRAVGSVDRMGVRHPQRDRGGLMVCEHDVAAKEGADRREERGGVRLIWNAPLRSRRGVSMGGVLLVDGRGIEHRAEQGHFAPL